MWASDSSNTKAHETKTHLAVQVIHAWTPPLPLQVEYQANMSYNNRVDNDQFQQTSGPSSVNPPVWQDSSHSHTSSTTGAANYNYNSTSGTTLSHSESLTTNILSRLRSQILQSCTGSSPAKPADLLVHYCPIWDGLNSSDRSHQLPMQVDHGLINY